MIKCPNCGFHIHRKKVSFRRSDPQNKYLHGVVIPVLSNHTGYAPEEMKGIIKWKFNIISTASLTTVEFEQFMSNVRDWALQSLDCYIPEPGKEGIE